MRRTSRIVEELCEEWAPHFGGYLTGFRDPDSMWRRVTKYRRAAGLRSELDVHALRRSAITYIVNELRLPDDFLNRAVGNGRVVRERAYVDRPTPGQVLVFIPEFREKITS